MYKIDRKVFVTGFLTSALAFTIGTFALEDKVEYGFESPNINHIEINHDIFDVYFNSGDIEQISREELNNSGLNIGFNNFEFNNGEEAVVNMQQPIGAGTTARVIGILGMSGSITAALLNQKQKIKKI